MQGVPTSLGGGQPRHRGASDPNITSATGGAAPSGPPGMPKEGSPSQARAPVETFVLDTGTGTILREVARRKAGADAGAGATLTLYPVTHAEALDAAGSAVERAADTEMMDDEGIFEADEREMAEYEEGVVWVGCVGGLSAFPPGPLTAPRAAAAGSKAHASFACAVSSRPTVRLALEEQR